MKHSFLPRVLWSLLIGAICVLRPPSASATSVVAPSFDDLVTKADAVFTGDVTGLRSEWTGQGEKRHIVTLVTFQVLRVLKGEAASPFELRVFGGTVGTETMEVADAPVFHVGERQILFVRHNGTQFIPLVGIMHGQYRVDETDHVADHTGHPLTRVEEIGTSRPAMDDSVRRRAAGNGAKLAPAAALSRAEFETQIAAKVEALHANAH